MWHVQIIPVLPREQLVAQWRELSNIAGNIKTKGTPNHILVNKVMDYPMDHFITYAAAVRAEMTKRGYRTMDKVWEKIISVCDKDVAFLLPFNEIYEDWMDDTYWVICYYNLKEKWMCGGIKDEDWQKLRKRMKHGI
jgi:uncharacterized protein (TIGR02328 family)